MPRRWLCLLVAACAVAGGIVLPGPRASAQAAGLRESDLGALLPGLEIRRSESGVLVLQTWRAPELSISGSSFQLLMHYDGLEDTDWPFPRTLAALVAKACGYSRPGWADDLTRELYASKSLVPETPVDPRNPQSNAGNLFKKRLVKTVGSCRIELVA